MRRVDDLERDRQIADIKAILESSMRDYDQRAAEPDDPSVLDDGETDRRSLDGFGDGFEPPRSAWRARLHSGRVSIGVFVVVAVLTAAATALVTWLLRPAGTAVEGAATTIAAADERADPDEPGGETASAAASPASTSSAPGVLVVAVVGSVNVPGLVTLPEGARVSDAIEAAGGALPGTDLSTLNIARKVADGEQIVVGLPGPPVDSGTSEPQPTANGGSTALVDINSANVTQLDELPGIGPVLAQRIVDFREENGPFKSVEELENVSGVGPAVLAKVKDLVTV
ncbi:ComEA family DNA-binding protein [Blastococcus sp. Marseille-P5729]|uniref:ComEA family DNA-binding protein n=1 Tax=Blastococcus sp. Marseille-P5729 TaxID=2086582 RepID=UPI000D10D36D|nr:ComEA family DNA-binding protein [Blastococcus sp. Marseille-P5729]